MPKASDLGEHVWVRQGKAEHDAFLVTDEPLIVEDGITMQCVYWPILGVREYVEQRCIYAKLKSRRRHHHHRSSDVRAVRTRPPDTRPVKKEEDVDDNKKPAAKRMTTKWKQRSTRTSKKGTDIVHVCAPGPWAYEIKQKAQKPGVIYNRPPTKDDIGYINNEAYVATGGFCAFYNRFEHIPNMTEVRHEWTGDRRYVYTDRSTLNPQPGQIEFIDDDDDEEGSHRIAPEEVGSRGALRRTTPTARKIPNKHNDWAHKPKIMAALAKRLQTVAKRAKKGGNRPATRGDLVTYQGRIYVVTGSSLFYGRFAHVMNQMELQCTTRQERVYVPQKCLESES